MRFGLTRWFLKANVSVSAEYCWLVALALLVALLIELPHAIAYSQSSNGLFFTGMFWSPHDFAQYSAAMREGAANASWSIHDRLTGEPHDPAFIYEFYVALGKIAAAFGIDLTYAYRVADFASRFILVCSLYFFNRAVLRQHREALFAAMLTVFAGGATALSYLVGIAVGSNVGAKAFNADVNLPEVSTFLTLFTAPHLVLGLALAFLILGFCALGWTRPERKHPVMAAACTVALGFVNPFSLPTVLASLIVHLAAVILMRRRIPLRQLEIIALIAFSALPFLAYSFLTFNLDPFWGVVYGKENVLASPVPIVLAAGFGVVLVLAAIGTPALLQGLRPERLLVVVAFVVGLSLMYVPTAYQRRFGFGLQPLLATAASLGLAFIWQRARERSVAQYRLMLKVALAIICFGLLVTNVAVYALFLQESRTATISETGWPVFQPASVVEASQWLSRNLRSDDDIIIADLPTSNFIAGLGRGRVYVGHPTATKGFAAKARQAAVFFSPQTSSAARSRFLADNHISYFFYGPAERKLISIQPEDETYLRSVYRGLDVQIYEVISDSLGDSKDRHYE